MGTQGRSEARSKATYSSSYSLRHGRLLAVRLARQLSLERVLGSHRGSRSERRGAAEATPRETEEKVVQEERRQRLRVAPRRRRKRRRREKTKTKTKTSGGYQPGAGSGDEEE